MHLSVEEQRLLRESIEHWEKDIKGLLGKATKFSIASGFDSTTVMVNNKKLGIPCYARFCPLCKGYDNNCEDCLLSRAGYACDDNNSFYHKLRRSQTLQEAKINCGNMIHMMKEVLRGKQNIIKEIGDRYANFYYRTLGKKPKYLILSRESFQELQESSSLYHTTNYCGQVRCKNHPWMYKGIKIAILENIEESFIDIVGED